MLSQVSVLNCNKCFVSNISLQKDLGQSRILLLIVIMKNYFKILEILDLDLHQGVASNIFTTATPKSIPSYSSDIGFLGFKVQFSVLSS